MRYDDIKTELHALLMLTGGALSLTFGDMLPLLIFGIIGFTLMWWRRDRILSNTSTSFGVANSITLGRLTLLILATLLYQEINPIIYGLAILLVIIADGIDGYYARKLNEESAFGAAFDMETDAFMAALVTTVISIYLGVGVWLLVAGFLRYMFVLLVKILGWHDLGTPHMPGAKLLAVLFFISLLLPFLLPLEYAKWGLMTGAMLVCFSFLREIVLLSLRRMSGSNK